MQALSCSGMKLSYYVLKHDLVLALLQGFGRVHIFCNRAGARLAIGGNDFILSLAHE